MKETEVRQQAARILVLGVGTVGGEAVNQLALLRPVGVELGVAHTDPEFLNGSVAGVRIPIGSGAAGSREDATKQTSASAAVFNNTLRRFDLVLLVAALGDAVGGGAGPEVARLARGVGALSVAAALLPAPGQDMSGQPVSEDLRLFHAQADAVFQLDPSMLLTDPGPGASPSRARDGYLRGVAELLSGLCGAFTQSGPTTLDLADARELMGGAGPITLVLGQGEGKKRAKKAINQALKRLKREPRGESRARGILVMVAAATEIDPEEQRTIADGLGRVCGHEPNVFWTHRSDLSLGEQVQITLLLSYGDSRPHWTAAQEEEIQRDDAPTVDDTISALVGILLDQGRQRIAEGDFGGAERQLSKAHAMAPDSQKVSRVLQMARFGQWTLRVKAGIRRQDLSLLSNLFNPDRRPDWSDPKLGIQAATYLNTFGILLARAGRLQEAEEQLLVASALAPDRPEIGRNLATVRKAVRR